MAPSKIDDAGLSEYELMRIRNMEENRRILESIRQEQLYEFKALLPPSKTKSTSTDGKPRKKKTRREEPRPPREAVEGQPQSDVENQGDTENQGIPARRKSARLSGKKPKYSLHGDDGDNDADEDFDSDKYSDDDSDDDEIEFSEGSSRKRKRPLLPAGPRPKVIVPKDRTNFYGAVPGIEIGKIWETRMACCADGVQRPPVAGIHGGPDGAYSIALSGGYEDDVDLGDCFTYTGEGGRALNGTKANPKNLRTAPQSKDQTLTKGNLALSLSVTSRNPVRVIRGSALKNEFAPPYGYRYDGLYTVEKFWSCVGKSGFKVYKFALTRCPNQAPPPWIVNPLSEIAESSVQDDECDPADGNRDGAEKPSVDPTLSAINHQE